MTDQATVRSLDDPNIWVETPATIYDAIPPYPPRTEREVPQTGARSGLSQVDAATGAADRRSNGSRRFTAK